MSSICDLWNTIETNVPGLRLIVSKDKVYTRCIWYKEPDDIIDNYLFCYPISFLDEFEEVSAYGSLLEGDLKIVYSKMEYMIYHARKAIRAAQNYQKMDILICKIANVDDEFYVGEHLLFDSSVKLDFTCGKLGMKQKKSDKLPLAKLPIAVRANHFRCQGYNEVRVSTMLKCKGSWTGATFRSFREESVIYEMPDDKELLMKAAEGLCLDYISLQFEKSSTVRSMSGARYYIKNGQISNNIGGCYEMKILLDLTEACKKTLSKELNNKIDFLIWLYLEQ